MLFVQDSADTRLDLLLPDTPYDVQAIQRGQRVEVGRGLLDDLGLGWRGDVTLTAMLTAHNVLGKTTVSGA